ncbi:MAG: putative DNA binding domain-containing protein [Eggerthellaceae bacterium]|nr:putative DNA binding domain-containing protein [Eggerthellaceae bacterium]
MDNSDDLELTESLSASFLKTVCAFANYGSGTILFGVNEKGEPVGIDNPRNSSIYIEHLIEDSIDPVPKFYLETDDVTSVVTLYVKEGVLKPYLYKGRAYKRTNGQTVCADRLDYGKLVLYGLNNTFDSLKAASQDLRLSLLEKNLRRTLGIHSLDHDTLIAFELLTPDEAYNNACALLADRNDFPGVEIVRFGGEMNIIFNRHIVENVSILEQLSQSLAIFEDYYEYEETIGSKKVRKSFIPREAFRKALAYALISRNWDLPINIKIGMYEDRVEIVSTGGPTTSIADNDYLKGGLSVSRNPILANIFFRMGLIDRFGTGISRVADAYSGTDVQPYFDITPAYVKVVLPVEGDLNITKDEKRVLDVMGDEESLTRTEIAERVKLSRDTTIGILNSLIQKSLVIRSGKGRAIRYSKINT